MNTITSIQEMVLSVSGRELAKQLKAKVNNRMNSYEGKRVPELDKVKEELEKSESVKDTEKLFSKADELAATSAGDELVEDNYNNKKRK